MIGFFKPLISAEVIFLPKQNPFLGGKQSVENANTKLIVKKL